MNVSRVQINEFLDTKGSRLAAGYKLACKQIRVISYTPSHHWVYRPSWLHVFLFFTRFNRQVLASCAIHSSALRGWMWLLFIFSFFVLPLSRFSFHRLLISVAAFSHLHRGAIAPAIPLFPSASYAQLCYSPHAHG